MITATATLVALGATISACQPNLQPHQTFSQLYGHEVIEQVDFVLLRETPQGNQYVMVQVVPAGNDTKALRAVQLSQMNPHLTLGEQQEFSEDSGAWMYQQARTLIEQGITDGELVATVQSPCSLR